MGPPCQGPEKELSGVPPALPDVGADVQLALATGSEPLRPANHALRATVLDDFFKLGDVMYARFKQENAIEVTMREMDSGEELGC
jgi:hypothetical protein